MKRILIDNKLKKKLTVQPYLPGSPIVVNYCMYKLDGKYMYIPKYYSKEGDNILNIHSLAEIKINTQPREYQKSVINIIHTELLKNDSCIACLYTGWGKTFASLFIAHLLGVKTLIIVNKESDLANMPCI